MKQLFMLWILIFTQWQVFSSDCNLTFDNQTPSYVMSQIEEIYLMDMETGLVCLHELKAFLIEPSPHVDDITQNIQNILHDLYGNNHQENLERMQYLMSALLNNQDGIQNIKTRMHPEISSQQMFPIRTTPTQITLTPSITSKPVLPGDKSPHLDKEIEQLQAQQKTSTLWNPFFFLLPPLPERDIILQRPSHTSENQEIIDTLNVDSSDAQQPRPSFAEEYVWTETLQIEFPAIIVCKQPADEMSNLFFTTLKKYEAELVEFTDNHIDMETVYMDIMEWLDSIRNQNGNNLQNTHPVFEIITYSTQLNQIPDFIMNGMTPEQKENFDHMMNLVKKYSWMYNLRFEYRACLPTAFRERLLFSYSVPVPLEITLDSQTLSEDHLDIRLSDINIFYELSAYTSSFVSPFKQSYPLRVFRQNNVSWNDFTSNELRNRYEANWVEDKKCKEDKANKEKEECGKIPESYWNTTLEFLKNFISKNRMYLNVSF